MAGRYVAELPGEVLFVAFRGEVASLMLRHGARVARCTRGEPGLPLATWG